MKNYYLLFLMIATLFSCNKNEEPTAGPDYSKSSVMNLRISVDKQKTRAMEGDHGALSKITPKIFTVTVYAYSEFGTATQIDLTPDQMLLALGEYVDKDGNPVSPGTAATGASIGLPAGTARVDVVLNNPESNYKSISENVNYYNYRKGELPGHDFLGDNNFDRVFLTTEHYGKGEVLSGEITGKDIPTYEMNFTVSPAMARFEVKGAINVATKKTFTDKWGIQWKVVAKAAISADDLTAITGALEGTYNFGITVGTGTGEGGNGFPVDTYYIPEHYWTGDPASKVAYDAASADWKTEPTYFGKYGALVEWYPNRYHAVDIEEIYINNIRVRSALLSPWRAPWPGSESPKGWPNWYKCFHVDGWHTAGVSGDNSFLCMGNMWDRIATSATMKNVDFTGLKIPSVDGGGLLSMQIIDGKAQAVASVSAFADVAGSRNLGVIAGKAAGYQIYAQGTTVTSKDEIENTMPHIIVKVKCYNNATDYAAGTYVKNKEFITIKSFNEGVKLLNQIEKSKIYNLDLAGLVDSFVGDVPVPGTEGVKPPIDVVDPDPEKPSVQLTMKITVKDWTVVNITPSV